MTSTLVAVIIAILAPGGLIVTLVQKARRENNRDHAANSTLLRHIDRQVDQLHIKVDRVDDRLHAHLSDHAKDEL